MTTRKARGTQQGGVPGLDFKGNGAARGDCAGQSERAIEEFPDILDQRKR